MDSTGARSVRLPKPPRNLPFPPSPPTMTSVPLGARRRSPVSSEHPPGAGQRRLPIIRGRQLGTLGASRRAALEHCANRSERQAGLALITVATVHGCRRPHRGAAPRPRLPFVGRPRDQAEADHRGGQRSGPEHPYVVTSCATGLLSPVRTFPCLHEEPSVQQDERPACVLGPRLDRLELRSRRRRGTTPTLNTASNGRRSGGR